MSKSCPECIPILLKDVTPEVYQIIQSVQAECLSKGSRLSLERVIYKIIKERSNT